MPPKVADIRDDIEAFAEIVAKKVVAMLTGGAESKSNGLKPYDALKYYQAIREARNGNNRPLQEYLRQYMPRPQ
jgi:hypothetical protein